MIVNFSGKRYLTSCLGSSQMVYHYKEVKAALIPLATATFTYILSLLKYFSTLTYKNDKILNFKMRNLTA